VIATKERRRHGHVPAALYKIKRSVTRWSSGDDRLIDRAS
jgi:hypothetical protein